MSRLLIVAAICLIVLGVFVDACSWGNPVWPKSQRSDTPLFRFGVDVNHRLKVGYINKSGKVVIPPSFETQGNYGYDDFFEGIALVQIGREGWYVNSKGEKLFRGRNSGQFSEGFATFDEGGKTGYLNKQGHVSIAPKFERAELFSEGLAAAAVDGRYGYIDRTGAFVIKPTLALALPFRGGIARVVKRSGCLYIGYGPCDFFNPVVLPFRLEKYQSPTMKEPRCNYSFIDRTGQSLFVASYLDAKDFAEGLAPVGDGNRWGYVDVNGNIAVPLQYQNAETFSEGLAAVQIKDKWGYVDHSGKLAIPATFSAAFSFSEGVGLVEDAASQYRFIDKRGQQIIPGSFTAASSFAMGLADVRNGVNYETATWAYIDHSGRSVFRYSENVK